MAHSVHVGVLGRILATATAMGVDPAELRQRAGLRRASLDDDDGRISAAYLYDLWHHAAATTGDRTLPTRVAGSTSLDALGLFGFAVMTAPTLLASLRLGARYYPLVTDSGAWRVHTSNQRVVVRWRRDGALTPGRQLANESALAHFTAGLRQVIGAPLPLRRVRLRHAPAGGLRALSEYFDCAVDIGAEHDELELPRAPLDGPARAANAAMHAYFCRDAEARLALLSAGNGGTVERARAELRRALPAGEAAMTRVARNLGMTTRTLRRHLDSAGTSFRALLDEVRMQEAAGLLEHTDLALSEVALELGFAEASAFSRAFRRWAGTSPSTWRRSPTPLSDA
ncbi:AraC family transcriptional regulator [Haliangium sp.]|uniref:AraC family transcriptional regulator n=1 Tax=Haliangium sp. TaxID=2663208 RepID=UPI003D0C56CE